MSMDRKTDEEVNEDEAAEYIKELRAKLAEYENPKNWTRPYNHEGELINEHALYKPKLRSV